MNVVSGQGNHAQQHLFEFIVWKINVVSGQGSYQCSVWTQLTEICSSAIDSIQWYGNDWYGNDQNNQQLI